MLHKRLDWLYVWQDRKIKKGRELSEKFRSSIAMRTYCRSLFMCSGVVWLLLCWSQWSVLRRKRSLSGLSSSSDWWKSSQSLSTFAAVSYDLVANVSFSKTGLSCFCFPSSRWWKILDAPKGFTLVQALALTTSLPVKLLRPFLVFLLQCQPFGCRDLLLSLAVRHQCISWRPCRHLLASMARLHSLRTSNRSKFLIYSLVAFPVADIASSLPISSLLPSSIHVYNKWAPLLALNIFLSESSILQVACLICLWWVSWAYLPSWSCFNIWTRGNPLPTILERYALEVLMDLCSYPYPLCL